MSKTLRAAGCAVAVATRRPAAVALAALLSAAVLGACMPRHEAAVPDPAHNSRNALDWPGVYEGTMPCASCPGIKTRLVLQRDGRFELSTQYIDRQPAPQTVRGSFSWDATGGIVTLEGPGNGQRFRVGEGRLLQLNRDGSSPPWDAPGRVLNQVSKS